MKAGDQIKVKRSSGEMEDDWYCWTDFDLPVVNKTSGFVAPEMTDIRVLVIKPYGDFTIEDVRNPDVPESEFYKKSVPLSMLMEWQKS